MVTAGACTRDCSRLRGTDASRGAQGYFEPCSAKWYLPMRVPASFWPGQISEAELVKVDREAGPARDRAR